MLAGFLPLAAVLFARGAAPVPPVAYVVSYTSPESRVHVTLTLPGRPPGPATLIVPRAVPMGYAEVPYDAFVQGVEAFAPDGSRLPVTRSEGPRWSLGEAGRRVARVRYDVDISRMEKETLDAGHASKARPGYVRLLGYSVFGFVEGMEGQPVSLRVDAPSTWPVFTTLAPRVAGSPGTASAEAADFYALADSQVVMGPNLRILERAGPVPLFLAAYDEGSGDPNVFAGLAAEALPKCVAYFGSTPFESYSVLVEYLEPVSPRHVYRFSMEHLASATMTFEKGDALTSGSPAADVSRARYNLAHHIAHSWIPKRASGEGYFPFSWELAPLHDTIWFSEGFGQYAAAAALAEGRADAEEFLKGLLDRRFRKPLEETPAFLKTMPLVTLSYVASTRYASDFRTGRAVFSRGGLMAAEMDERIRSKSGGTKSLRDALRALVAWSARTHRAFRIDELPAIFRDATGVDVSDVMAKWLAPMR